MWRGALFTAFLFMPGRFVISFSISRTDFGSTYGAVGSRVFLRVPVYHSSLILYWVVEFSKMYTAWLGAGIHPRKDANSTVEINTNPKNRML